jgi:hypothetical protein
MERFRASLTDVLIALLPARSSSVPNSINLMGVTFVK